MKKKETILIIITILVSCLYLFSANKFVTRNEIENSDMMKYDVYTARVIDIFNIQEEEYNLGYDVVTGVLVNFYAEVLSGELKGQIVECRQEISPFFAIQPEQIDLGDKILISQSFNYGLEDTTHFDMLEYVRTDTIIILILIFFAGILWFGRKKGFLTIISLSLTCVSIFAVFIPAILNGYNVYFWAVLTCIFIVAVTLMLVNGFDEKSLSAGIGCVAGVLVSGLLVGISGEILKLTGLIDEQSVFLQMLIPEKPIDVKAIIFASIIIGAVGAIMDVAISIASSLSEIKMQNSEANFKDLYNSGVNIGRDILGTMTNTLILAYIGSSLSMVLLLIANTGSMIYLINTESIIIEVLQSVIGSLGILLTLPFTSVICAFLYTRQNKNNHNINQDEV